MEKQETNIVLQRIKTFYPKFYYASYTVENWYMELKDYKANTIVEALRIYAEDNQDPPSVINLKSIADRLEGQVIFDYNTTCKFCGRVLNKDQIEIHEDRCRSIKYMERKYMEIFGKVLDKKYFWEISKEEFDEKYDSLLKIILDKTTDPQEKEMLTHYFYD